MRPVVSCAIVCALIGSAHAQKPQWVTVKGQVVFPADKAIPERKPLNVNQDKPHCLKDGPLLDESILIDAKTRGVKNVVVYLRPDNNQPNAAFAANEIHPADAKRKAAEVVIDQPCCLFVNRVTVARVGDAIVVKNPAPVAHNFFWNSGNNGNHNPTLAANTNWKMPAPLAQESAPIPFKCSVHPWMAGYVRVFDHPYYAVTDANGRFEIKDAPAGKYRVVYWHENSVRGGAQGRFGEPIAIDGDAKGTMELKPTDFDVSPK